MAWTLKSYLVHVKTRLNQLGRVNEFHMQVTVKHFRHGEFDLGKGKFFLGEI